VLGDEDLAEYRRVVNEAAAHLVGDEIEQWSSPRFRIRRARVGIALATADIGELISLLTSERLLPDDCLTIVNALTTAGRVQEAVDWAHRGLDAPVSSEHYRRELRDRLVEILLVYGEVDEVRAVLLQGFRAAPTPEAFRGYLGACDDEHRVTERLKLLEWLEERAVEQPGSQTAESLTKILLSEGEVDAAYSAATRFGCALDLRRTLARAIEKSRPRDAIALYQLEIDHHIDRKRGQDYQLTAALLVRVRRLYAASDDESGWTTYLRAVATTHKAKSSLMAILRKQGILAAS
jgi:uncharacterized Zn finger protein